jgi:hypothetical protein
MQKRVSSLEMSLRGGAAARRGGVAIVDGGVLRSNIGFPLVAFVVNDSQVFNDVEFYALQTGGAKSHQPGSHGDVTG